MEKHKVKKEKQVRGKREASSKEKQVKGNSCYADLVDPATPHREFERQTGEVVGTSSKHDCDVLDEEDLSQVSRKRQYLWARPAFFHSAGVGPPAHEASFVV